MSFAKRAFDEQAEYGSEVDAKVPPPPEDEDEEDAGSDSD